MTSENSTQPNNLNKPSGRKHNKVLLGISIGILAVAVIGGGILLLSLFTTVFNQPLGEPLDLPATATVTAFPASTEQITEEPVDEGPPPVCGDVDEMTFLLVGTDFRGSNYLYGLADVIRVVHVDFTIPQVNVVAIPRMVLIEDVGPNLEVATPVLINQTYLFGTQGMGHFSGSGYGAGALAETLQTNFDINVDNYLVINFATFENFIDSIGGISVTLPAAVDAEPLASFPAGTQWLTGEKALILARTRKNSSEDVRIDHQSLIIQGIFERLTDPTVLANFPDVINTFSSAVLTDLTPAQIQTGLCMLGKVDPASIQYFNPGDDILTYSRAYIPTMSKEMFILYWDQDFVDWIHESLVSIPEEQ